MPSLSVMGDTEALVLVSSAKGRLCGDS